MAADPRSSRSVRSLFLNSSEEMNWDYYNWCNGYPTVLVIWSALSVICFLLGFPASLWVLHELVRKQRQRSSGEIFMISLAVIDLIFTAQIPVGVCNFMLWKLTQLEHSLDFMYSLSLSGRPLFMACICWDCFMAVVFPIIYKTSRNLLLLKKTITAVIFFNIVLGGVIVSTKPWIVTTFYIASPLSVALPVIAFCDFSILQTLRKPDPTGNIIIHPQKKRALHTISNSLVMTFVVYLPPVIIFTFGDLIPVTQTQLFCCLDFVGFCFNTSGCVIMPLLYLDTAGKLERLKICRRK